METQRFLAACAALLALPSAQGDVYMGVAADKTFIQQSPFKFGFTGGDLNLILRDGLVILDGACVTDPQPIPFGPSAIPPCPLGATGFVAQGDIDRDGVRDDLQYWSVLSIIPALIIEPSRPELCQLAAGPASKLPRPLQNFRDDSLVTFYDIRTTTMTDYDQSRYELIRTYGSVRQVETLRALGPILNDGTINVTVTGAGIAGSPLVIPVDVLGGMAAIDWAELVRVALGETPEISALYDVGGLEELITLTEREPNGNDPTLLMNISSGTAIMLALPINSVNTVAGVNAPIGGGLKQMNEEIVPGQYIFTFPRLGAPETATPVAIPVVLLPMPEPIGTTKSRQGFRFSTGLWDLDYMQFDPRVINQIGWTGIDTSVVRPGDRSYISIENTTAPGGSAVGGRDFPPTGNSVLLTTPTTTSYTLPPFFLNVGDEGEMLLSYQRNLPSNGVAYDVSTRDFRVKVRMIDSYMGFAQISFPLATPPQDLQPNADVDFDGMININEYAYEWPTRDLLTAVGEDPDELGVGDPLAIDPLKKPALPVVTLDADNHIVVRASLRPLTGTSLKYTFSILDTSGKRPKFKNIKAGRDWQITRIQETETVLVGATNLDLPHDYIVLRSTAPVADPAAPLPNIQIKITPVGN
jgi:hypothetical protein